MFIDTHCHLDFDVFDHDREAMFERAHRVGIERFVVPGTQRARFDKVIALGERRDVDICLGLHPYFLDEHNDAADLEALEQALIAHSAVALGECGLDDRFASLDRQWSLFDAQLKLAKRLELPVIIHSVGQNDEIGKRLKQLDLPARGLIHAFSGSQQQAERFIGLGYSLGIGGAVTHERAQKLKRVVAALPEEAFVLESDAPDMAPQGIEGRNEPACLQHVIDEVARLRHTTPEALAESTRANVVRLLGR